MSGFRVHVSVFCFAVFLLAQSVFALSAWPAESFGSATDLTSIEGVGVNGFHEDLSGVFWNPVSRRLWVVRNSAGAGGQMWSVVENGSENFTVEYKEGNRGSWSGFGDLEDVTQANYSEEYTVYLIIEGTSHIREYDLSTYGTATLVNDWNTSPFLPVYSPAVGLGPEGIAFVPDSFLAAQGFRNSSGELYTSRNGMDGLMFVAHQNGGRLYAFDLNRADSTFSFVGSYLTNYTESCALAFDQSNGFLYVFHGDNHNTLEVVWLNATGGKLNQIAEYARPTGSAGDSNMEGIAMFSEEDCSYGKRSFFLTIDDGGAQSFKWFRNFSHGCEATTLCSWRDPPASGSWNVTASNNCTSDLSVDGELSIADGASLTFESLTATVSGGLVRLEEGFIRLVESTISL